METENRKDKLPQHVGIIMDGNGRWAKKRRLPRNYGHKKGVETLRAILTESGRLGIPYLTVYAFSTENWKRPQEEVGGIMKLLLNYLANEISTLMNNQVRFRVIGDSSRLPLTVSKKLEETIEKSKDNTGITFTVALNYGSRHDIAMGIRAMMKAHEEGTLPIEDITEETLRSYLSTYFLPDPDLIIRPSGELRLSNFLLWESAYSEFWFDDIFWPDFGVEDYHRALRSYADRDRRFGSSEVVLP